MQRRERGEIWQTMRTVKPVQPIRAVRAIGRVMLRPAPSMGQLRLWLWFARQKAKERAAPSAPRLDSVGSPEARDDWQREDATNAPAGNAHIDKRV